MLERLTVIETFVRGKAKKSAFLQARRKTGHKVSAKCLPLCIAELQFRYNTRFNDDIL